MNLRAHSQLMNVLQGHEAVMEESYDQYILSGLLELIISLSCSFLMCIYFDVGFFVSHSSRYQ